VVHDVPTEYCDDLDVLTNDIDYLMRDDTFDKMVYDPGSFPKEFARWFIKKVVPLYNAAGSRIVTLKVRQAGRVVLTVADR
jgi:hypothetical protein